MKKITEKMAEFIMDGKGCFTVWHRVVRTIFFIPFIVWACFVAVAMVVAFVPYYIATGKDILK